MVRIANNADSLEIERRAKQIRSQWSSDERVRRMGLPPDVPARLREFILGCRQSKWAMIGPHK